MAYSNTVVAKNKLQNKIFFTKIRLSRLSAIDVLLEAYDAFQFLLENIWPIKKKRTDPL